MKGIFGLLFGCMVLLPQSLCPTVDKKDFIVPAPVEVSQETQVKIKNKSPEELIKEAKTAYEWFVVCKLEGDWDMPGVEINGKTYPGIWIDGGIYRKVKDERYNTREKLDKYLRTLFSGEIVEQLWGEDCGGYKEVDGFLYTNDGARGEDPSIAKEEYSTKEFSDDKAVYRVLVTHAQDGEVFDTREHEFVMEKINGNWVFTTFPFYW